MYQNNYNQAIATKVRQNAKKQTQRQDDAATMGDTSFTSHLEGMALRDAKVEGGSGYAEATVGFPDEKTMEPSAVANQLQRRRGVGNQNQRL